MREYSLIQLTSRMTALARNPSDCFAKEEAEKIILDFLEEMRRDQGVYRYDDFISAYKKVLRG